MARHSRSKGDRMTATMFTVDPERITDRVFGGPHFISMDSGSLVKGEFEDQHRKKRPVIGVGEWAFE